MGGGNEVKDRVMASPGFARVVSMLRSTQPREGDPLDYERFRRFLTAMAPRPPNGVRVLRTEVAGRTVDWVVPEGADPNVRLLYLHGGAFIAGSVHTHRALAARIAEAAGCVGLVVDYRIAPEDPFPAALEDCIAALEYAAHYGPDGALAAPRSLFVGGDSAGGGLTLSTLIETRGQVPVTAAVTLSAWTDLTCSGESLVTRAGAEPVLAPHLMLPTAATYLAGHDARDPRASPLYGDLAGLPPLLMQVGDAEILLDDTRRFAAKARTSGVDVRCEVWPEMFHVFQGFSGILPEGQEAIASLGAYLREHSA
jgi:monoterpene epsilon-lactone hydrolase